jgi:CheY-like chemotaxis protein
MDPVLESTTETKVTRDPPSLPEGEGALPSFWAVPEALKTILVVEDNAIFRRFLKDILVSCGFTVYEAASGDEGLRLALAKKPWLVVTDITMPGLDGLELCRSIRSHSPICHTPVVFLSGWDDYQRREQGLDAGASDFLSKRLPVREFLIRIRLILEKHSDTAVRQQERPGIEGRIDAMGATGLLQMCHIGRLTGLCHIRSGSRAVVVRFREGEVVGAERLGLQGIDVIHDLISWTSGRFEFIRTAEMPGEPIGDSFEALMLEGARIQDEKSRAGEGS